MQQAFAQHANLSTGTSSSGSPQAQLLHQYIGGSGEQNAELVGPEAGATGAVDFEVVQFLDAVFYVTALAVDMFVNPLRTLFHVGDDKPGIVFGILIGSADDLGFDEDAAQIGPLPDRKSTRLNSSHQIISYAVFCLKKKKKPCA